MTLAIEQLVQRRDDVGFAGEPSANDPESTERRAGLGGPAPGQRDEVVVEPTPIAEVGGDVAARADDPQAAIAQ
jgi:hypothetical protein